MTDSSSIMTTSRKLDASLERASCPGWPRRRCQSEDSVAATKDWAAGSRRGYNGPELLHLTITFRDRRSFTEHPVGSNSTEQLLSIVNRRTEIRFLISCGETSTLLRRKDGEITVEPVDVTGSKDPLPTTMDDGVGYREEVVCESELECDDMWEVALYMV